MSQKAFLNTKHNAIQLTFPNGNWISTVWGVYTYSDNYRPEDINPDPSKWHELFQSFMDSDTVEIMFTCSKALKKRILDKYNEGDDDPIGWLSIAQWLEIVNLLASAPKRRQSTSK